MIRTSRHSRCISSKSSQAGPLLALVVLLASTIAIQSAQAQTFGVLLAFTEADGTNSVAGLVHDAAGNLYGTTSGGGAYNVGTIFELDTTGTLTVLHSLSGSDGETPEAALIRDEAGNLYGTAFRGADSGGSCSDVAGSVGCGTVFRLDTAGTFTVLHTFSGTDGAGPVGLLRDGAGSLFGVTSYGGVYGFGVVFSLSPATGAFRVIHSFHSAVDGAYPSGTLTCNTVGNLYGTASQGGASGYGTAFQLNPATGKFQVLHSFGLNAEGGYIYAGLVRDAAGNLYGGAAFGGIIACDPPRGCGTLFKLDTAGKLSVLRTLSGPDGAYAFRGMIQDATGNLYGTTEAGGPNGYGTVFSLNPLTTKFELLHSFDLSIDGGDVYTTLSRDAEGNLYGTTSGGGAYGDGTVFRVSP
jgi:uncharacterized repeat protein (TIGR03803 family)